MSKRCIELSIGIGSHKQPKLSSKEKCAVSDQETDLAQICKLSDDQVDESKQASYEPCLKLLDQLLHQQDESSNSKSENLCVLCGENMGENNPRQLCYKTYCGFITSFDCDESSNEKKE